MFRSALLTALEARQRGETIPPLISFQCGTASISLHTYTGLKSQGTVALWCVMSYNGLECLAAQRDNALAYPGVPPLSRGTRSLIYSYS
jgi:hypothetical protein